ncbi:thymidylate synthase [Burkholderia sp. NLJ2]|uniref:thymidylate synthase n=1 Tax=Burkholderia sp. NLJ2 TaxID=3090699 RepID=UPI003C6BEF60
MENLLLKTNPRADVHHGFTNIYGDTVDDLVRQGIRNIVQEGRPIKSRAGDATQAYGVNYVLNNPRNRVHSLRNGAKKYFCRELIAYFSGSLKAESGLANASKFWMTLTDKDGNVNSNYGYYVFYEPVEKYGNQYNWIVSMLTANQDSRRAIININQNYHKSDTKDFPCTIGMQFFIRENHLYCETISRSTDVITGLPYDMGFFSFIHELIYSDLVSRGCNQLKLGSTIMKTTFTQIYDHTMSKAKDAIDGRGESEAMPLILSASETLDDIYKGSAKTDIMKWIYDNAE